VVPTCARRQLAVSGVETHPRIARPEGGMELTARRIRASPVFLGNHEIRRCDLCGRRRASDAISTRPEAACFSGTPGVWGRVAPSRAAAKLESDSEGARSLTAPSAQPAQCSSHLRRKRRFELCSRTPSAIRRWLPRCAPRVAASSARRAVFPKRLLHTKGLRFRQQEVQILEPQMAHR